MAIDNQFGKGIGVAAGFDLGAQKPLDSRLAVNTIAERDAHVENNRAYEGMIVFVDETKKNYQLVNGEWVELLKAEQDRLDALEAMLNGEGEEGQGGALGALQDNIDAVQDNLDQAVEDLEGAMETEAARVNQKIADDIATESALRQQAESDLQDAIDAVNNRLEQNGDIEGRIAQAESDIDALQGLVGNPADADNEATGLHLALDNVKAELEQDILDEKDRAEGQEAAIRQEMADEATRVNQKIADDIATESALRVAEEARIEGLVTAEAQRADAEEKRIVGLVEAEAEAARAAELKLTQDLAKEVENREQAVQDLADRHDEEMEAAEGRLDVLEGLVGKPAVEGEEPADATGLHLALDNAKAELNQAIVNEAARAAEEEGKIRQELADEAAEIRGEIEELHNQLDADIEEQHQAMNEAMEAAVKEEKERAEGKEAELLQAINDEVTRADAAEKANKAVIDKLDGAVDVEGSVKKQIKDAVDALQAVHDQEIDAAEGRIKANEDALAIVNGAENVEGSIAKAEKDAKDYTDQKIADLIDSAPDAMNTLNELAQAIKDHGDVYEGYVAEHAEAMAQQKADLQAEIDADVKVVADELAKQKDAEQEGTLANQIADEVARADAEEKAIRQLVANEKAALQGEIDADVAAEAALRVAEEAKIRQELTDAAAAIRGEMAEQHQAMNQAAANETARVNQKIADDIAAESALRVAEEQRIEKALVDEAAEIRGELADAIAKEVEDRDAAILVEQQRAEGQEAAIRGEFAAADVALHAAIKGEMAAVIQSLVAEITEEGMLRIALGGIQGDDVLVIREQEIPFVTDDEIDEIIAGLDAVQGE